MRMERPTSRAASGRQGLTLVELLVATAIFAMLGTATVSLVSACLATQLRTRARSRLYQEGLLAMERMSSGLRRSTFVQVPNAHSPTRDILIFSGALNWDNDSYFADPLFPRIDEDPGADMTWDFKNGVAGIDDDGDGLVDENAGSTETIRSEFNTMSYASNDGTVDWNHGGLEEKIESDGPASGKVRLRARTGFDSHTLRIGGDEVYINGTLTELCAPLDHAEFATLSFVYGQSGERGGTVMLSVEGEVLQTYTVGGSGGPTPQSFDISHLMSGHTHINLVGSGETGEPGYIYFDNFQVRYQGDFTGSSLYDDDEDGKVDEDPVDGIDNDLDGNIDEDPGSDATADGQPGIVGMDDDGDGQVDDGGSGLAGDDDEDGLPNEVPVTPVMYRFDATNTALYEIMPALSLDSALSTNVSGFSVTHESPDRIRIDLDLFDASGERVSFSETVTRRNVRQRTGKRVR